MGRPKGSKNKKKCEKCEGTGVQWHPDDMRKIGKNYAVPKHSWRKIACTCRVPKKEIQAPVVVEMYPELKRPAWMKKDAKVQCLGEGKSVFTVECVLPHFCASVLITKDGLDHGAESWSKLSLHEE
jgi:hypothetical protein